jgi:hypothetical protein
MSIGNLTEVSASRKLSWDTAISDAKSEITKAKQRITRLRASIRTFEERKRAGDQFPGTPQSGVPSGASTQN